VLLIINKSHDMRFEVFMVVKIAVDVTWVVMPCSAVEGYQRLGDLDASIFDVKCMVLESGHWALSGTNC
jgi:hypothetical protein